ncbi:hypothetical protein IHE44_0014717 [Lamprotornis superbus]|uniref:Uncharacterized protein n=1 Tax=Lamprotornis superbus TaxID=245042 RepID=A0A835NLT1_9PASS|nr:hypothetical protein IHE44_0014717 [Lamprotornis superbus]
MLRWQSSVCSGVTMLELPSPPTCSVPQCRGPCAVGCVCINPSQAFWSTAVCSELGFGINARLFGIKAASATQPGLGADTPGVVLCIGSAVASQS